MFKPITKTRSNHQRGAYSQTRAVSIEPKSLDEKSRSVEAIAATEAPVPMPDYELGMMVPEVLLMSGLRIPESKSLPLQDSHKTSSVFFTLGSFIDLHVSGENYQGRATFSDDDDGNKAFSKVKGGHVKSFSVGYEVHQSIFIPEKQSQVIGGRSFSGPIRVVTDWEAYEVSLTAFPADLGAKARTEPEKKIETPVISSAKRADAKTGGSFFMNKWLRFILIQRGLAEGSTEEQAKAFFDALTSDQQNECRTLASVAEKAVANGGKDPEAEQRAKEEGQRAEADRQNQIRSMCQLPGCEDLAEELCKDPKITPEIASKRVIERAKETRKPVGNVVSMGLTEGEKFRTAVIDGVLSQHGAAPKTPAPGHEEFRMMTPSRIAEECLRLSGVNTRSMSKAEIVRSAMKRRGAETIAHGTAHFPYILENIANKMAMKGFEEAPRQWPLLAAVKSVSDFKEFSITGISGAEDLDEIVELAPYTEGEFNERREKAKLAKYGKKFSISFEGMVNDNLGEFTSVPRRHGQAAARTIEKLVFGVLTGNPVMGDTKTLFHADHNNSMSADALDSAALGAMRAAMRNQKGHGKDSECLDIPMSRIITGTSLEYTANLLTNSIGLPDSGISAAVANPNRGLIAVSSGLITSATAYYGSADPNLYDTIIIGFLDGKQSPDLEEIFQTDVDGYVFKVRIIAVAKAADWLGLIYNPGA